MAHNPTVEWFSSLRGRDVEQFMHDEFFESLLECLRTFPTAMP